MEIHAFRVPEYRILRAEVTVFLEYNGILGFPSTREFIDFPEISLLPRVYWYLLLSESTNPGSFARKSGFS